ncbi:sorting nexin-13-like [Sycon ciliatum]|uniref:sorting nexin-13-like n=1 Tax=Sycon ciliatum TaxID=27933 RepID=UPI0031F6750B
MASRLETAGWLVLTVALFLSSIGISTILFWSSVLGAFVAGFFVIVLYQAMHWSDKTKQDAPHLRPNPPVTAMDKVTWHHADEPITFKVDKRLTGAMLIDTPLQDCLNYLCRDYVEWFYYAVGAHPAFLNEVHVVLRQIIINFSARAKEVEWTPFFTKRIPDDFASHLRLYRLAQERLRKDKDTPRNSIPGSLSSTAVGGESRPSTPLSTSVTSDGPKEQTEQQKVPEFTEFEQLFFEVEKRMEHCLPFEAILCSPELERDYLRDISEIVLYLLLPEGDFENKVLRQLLKEVMVNTVFLPLVERMADEDYVNQTLTWLLKPSMFTAEIFTHIVKTSRSVVELEEVLVQIEAEIAKTREHDSGDDPGSSAKQTLDSLSHLKTFCMTRLDQLHHGILDPQSDTTAGEDSDVPTEGSAAMPHAPTGALPSLPLEVVLGNNVALSYLCEFLENRPEKKLVQFWLTCEAFRTSAQQKIQARKESLQRGDSAPPEVEDLRQMAMSIYDSYLGEAVRLKCFSSDVCQYVWSLINTRPPSSDWFDEAQKQSVAEVERSCYPEYQRSSFYSQCLRQLSTTSHSDDLDSISVQGDDGDFEAMLTESVDMHGSSSQREDMLLASGAFVEPLVLTSPSGSDQVESVAVTVPSHSIARYGTKSIVRYTLHLYCKYANTSNPVTWSVSRRYSDFVNFHVAVVEKSNISAELPPKRAFNNLDPAFLEKRRLGLEAYLKTLVSRESCQAQPGILQAIIHFADSSGASGENSGRRGTLLRKRLNVTGSVSSSLAKVIKNSPITVRRSEEEVTPEVAAKAEDVKMSATINEEDNIPLRIILLLMDEVFDFATTNRWLRRHVIVILRGLMKKTFGDTINRKIVDQVEYLTSAEQIAEFIKVFRESYWPNGLIGPYYAPRPKDQKIRTEIAAKVMLLGSVPDELKRFIGTKATEEGILRVFDMFQYRRLNKRLFYLIMEAFLETLFRGNSLPQIFKHLHSARPHSSSRGPTATG